MAESSGRKGPERGTERRSSFARKAEAGDRGCILTSVVQHIGLLVEASGARLLLDWAVAKRIQHKQQRDSEVSSSSVFTHSRISCEASLVLYNRMTPM